MLRALSCACLLLIIFQTHAANGLQQTDIEKFRLECWSNPAYDIDLKFAPVGEKIVSKLVYPASKGQEGYSLTFYYMPTPALRLINAEGYRWPSFKHVDQQGRVYGFVL